MKNEKVNKDCENCVFYGSVGDAPQSVKKDCMYLIAPDYDAEGYIIDAPPCKRD